MKKIENATRCSWASLGFGNSGMRVKINEVLSLVLKVLLVIATLPAPGAEERWLVEKTECPKVTYGKHKAKLVGGGFECQEEMERGKNERRGKEVR